MVLAQTPGGISGIYPKNNFQKIESEIFTCLAPTFKKNFQNIKNKNNCLGDHFYF